MAFDITKLSEAELIELNRRIVERLQLMRFAKNLTQLARFSVGMMVEFDAEDGRTITGTVARLNQKTATIYSSVVPGLAVGRRAPCGNLTVIRSPFLLRAAASARPARARPRTLR